MTEEREYPRWVHCPGTIPGKKSALVSNAAEEDAQLEAWGVDTVDVDLPPKLVNALLQLGHDGSPGGSLKAAGDDLPALRIAYKAKFGKRAFPGWNAAEITKRMEADA